jgi:LssY C-terminus
VSQPFANVQALPPVVKDVDIHKHAEILNRNGCRAGMNSLSGGSGMREAGRATQWLALVSILLLGIKESPPRKERFMKSKSGLGLFLGSAIFLSALIPALAQSTGDVSSPPAQQPAVAAEAKTAALANAGKVIQTKDFTLEGAKVWVETGISLEPGQKIVVTSEGTLRYADAKTDNGPDGLTRNFKDLIRILPYNGAGRGAVIGRIGDADIAQPFVIGAKKEIVAPVSGKLSLGINQSDSDTGTGSYTVKVEIYAADTSTPREIAKEVSSIPGVDNKLFEKIPRRIGDKDGNAGDMVNFLILGDEDQMKKVFTTAGWVKVDANVAETVLAGFIASMSKESYLTMPMSPLYLFGRPQDYGWAHAEPITVVASRNHLRVWKAPFTVNGQMLWVGAATHDIGFEKDRRNNGLTHKIDPDIDLEKDYVQKTLSSTGLVAVVTHFLPKQPMLEARTATGGSFHSNGQVLVMKLSEAAKSSTAEKK